MPRPIFTIPRSGTIPIPRTVRGEVTLPPVSLDIPEGITVGQPHSSTAGSSIRQIEKSTGIDWHNPPSGPDGLGSGWEELPERAPGRRSFKNSEDDNEIIHFDKGRPGKGRFQENDHWHRRNPEWKKSDGKRGYYLDRDGNPVNDGDNASHMEAGTGNVTALATFILIGKKPNWLERNIVIPIKKWNKKRVENDIKKKQERYEQATKHLRA